MRILLINPNTTEALTARLAAVAAQVLPADITLVPTTAEAGFPYISSRAEAQIAGADVLATIARHRDEVDAVVIAAFGDPGLLAARELFDLPVTGMTEAAMVSALMLGQRFAFVTFAARLAPWYGEQVRQAELGARYAGVFTPDLPLGAIDRIDSDMREPLIAECRRAVAAGADVLILSGAPLAGMAATLTSDIPAVLVDPVQAAVLQAASLARLAPRGASAGSFARPPAKDSTGLPADLARVIADPPAGS